MATRNSGYERQPNDFYQTPQWVTDALVPHLPARIKRVWEPAAGHGKMVRALERHGYEVIASDINPRGNRDCESYDFVQETAWPGMQVDAIITNPPFNQAQQFIERAFNWTGFVAMLLPVNYDCAKSRAHLFADNPNFSKKIVLTRRIVFFDRPGAAPSSNHCWMIWDKTTFAPTILGYGP